MDIDTLPDNSKYAPKDIPIIRIIELKLKGLSNQQIADILKCSKTNIGNRLLAIDFNADDLQIYKDKRSDIQAFIQSRIASKQIDYLVHPDTKINNAAEYKAMTISKAVETEKEGYINQTFTQVNIGISLIDDKIAELKARLLASGIDTVSTLDVTPDKVDK